MAHMMMSDQVRTVLAVFHYQTTGLLPPEYAEAWKWCDKHNYVNDGELTEAGKTFFAARTPIRENSYR